MKGKGFIVLGLLFLFAALVSVLFRSTAWFFTFIIMGTVSIALGGSLIMKGGRS